MRDFPPDGTPPERFLEEWLPAAFAEAELPAGAGEADLQVGLRLDGEGGGEWVLHLREGRLQVERRARDEAALTFVQSVEDWRGALWQGRGGFFGRQAAELFRPGALADRERKAGAGALRRPDPGALGRLSRLEGVVKMVVRGDEAGEDDWAVTFKLGPGPIPEEPTATVIIGSRDAEALDRGELDPMQALLSGRVQITGDMGLMMQMQMAAAGGPQP